MPVQFYIMLAMIVPLLVLVVILSSKGKNLNSIKAKTVGDGQHGGPFCHAKGDYSGIPSYSLYS